VFFFSVLLLIAHFDPTPTQFSWFIYNCVLALSAGGVAGLLPGTLNVNWPSGVRATGALAFAIVVFYLGHLGQHIADDEAKVQNLDSYLVFPDNSPFSTTTAQRVRYLRSC
jgi:hypothetical protein